MLIGAILTLSVCGANVAPEGPGEKESKDPAARKTGRVQTGHDARAAEAISDSANRPGKRSAMAAIKATKKQDHNYPFVFFNHGLWGYSDEIASLHVSVVFESDVPEGARSRIETFAPPPIGSFWWPLASVMAFGSKTDDYFDAQVSRAYRASSASDAGDGEEGVTKPQAQAFCAALDDWLIATHARAPINAVLGWIGKVRKDPWGRWSASMGLQRALPRLLQLQQEVNAGNDAGLRREIAHHVYAAVVARFEHTEWSGVAAEEQELVKNTLKELRGVDESIDYNARWLYRRLTGDVLKKR